MVVCLLSVSQAQVMSSTNYKMQSDSVNTGGILSTSTNYRLEDTAGEVATGNSSSTNYRLKAGYQQMREAFISLSAVPNVAMVPNLGGLTGGTATGSTAFLVITDSAAGYTVTIRASTSPALRSGANSIADYVPAGGVPDFVFTTGATNAHFAYSPEGPDIAARFRDNGSACGVGSGDTSNRCFDGLSTTPVEIVRRTSSNQPSGSTTTLRFAVGLGGNVGVAPGSYQATTTITALAL
jgi:hypothetical protein